MASILDVLTEMGQILAREGRTAEADRLAQIATVEDGAQFAARVTDLAIWGGAGSVVDASLEHPADDRRFNVLIVDLAQALDLLGIATPRTRWVAQTIEDWLNSHPI